MLFSKMTITNNVSLIVYCVFLSSLIIMPIDCGRLIAEIHNKPFVWDTSSKMYKDRDRNLHLNIFSP